MSTEATFECRSEDGEVVVRRGLTDAIAKAQSMTASRPRKRCIIRIYDTDTDNQVAMVFRKPSTIQRALGHKDWPEGEDA